MFCATTNKIENNCSDMIKENIGTLTDIVGQAAGCSWFMGQEVVGV